jgi:hypothetical protein
LDEARCVGCELEQSLRDLDLAVENAEMAITIALSNVLEMCEHYLDNLALARQQAGGS